MANKLSATKKIELALNKIEEDLLEIRFKKASLAQLLFRQKIDIDEFDEQMRAVLASEQLLIDIRNKLIHGNEPS